MGEFCSLSRGGDAEAGRLSEGTPGKGSSSVADLSTGDDRIAPAVEGLSLVALNAAVGRFKVCELLLVRPCGLLPGAAGAAGAATTGEVRRGGRVVIGALTTLATLSVVATAVLIECSTTVVVLPASVSTDNGLGIISTRSMK